LEGVWIFLPIIGAIDTRRTVRGIKSDTVRRYKRPATNIEDTRGLVWKHNRGGAEYVRLDMHFAPSMTKIVDKAQVELVCASGVRESCAAFLEEGHLSILTKGGKQGRYKTRNEVLHREMF
jgi:hypothetical protein